MQQELIARLRCPASGQGLVLEEAEYAEDRIRSGVLASQDGRHRYPVRNFIPRFVPVGNYADNFGMQWNKFRQTQLDSCSGHSISADRFWKSTGWTPDNLKDRWILDAGCGAGRFAEVALRAGAIVVALDYSTAVDACYANLKHFPNLHVVQGDIYALPFQQQSFASVYSLGVLQHTPDVAAAFASLPPMVAPGGRLCVDFYPKSLKTLATPKYWLRPVTRRLEQERLFAALQTLVPKLLRASRLLGRVPGCGGSLRRLVPVADYEGVLPLTEQQRHEWALLDTFDWLSPRYDNPQTARTVTSWLQQSGMQQIKVFKSGHLIGRGTAADAARR